MIYIALMLMVLVAIFTGFNKKINFQKFESWYFYLLLVTSIVANLSLLKYTLFHSRFVPGNLKDGVYGLMAGSSFGAIMLNLMISSLLLGVLLRYKKNSVISDNDIATVPTKKQFPEWFNTLAHVVSGGSVGLIIGIALLNLVKGAPLEELGGLVIGTTISLGGSYFLAGIVVVINKVINRTQPRSDDGV